MSGNIFFRKLKTLMVCSFFEPRIFAKKYDVFYASTHFEYGSARIEDLIFGKFKPNRRFSRAHNWFIPRYRLNREVLLPGEEPLRAMG